MSQDTTASPSRRTIAKGLAWSVPAVAVAATTPAFAASRTVTISVVAGCPSSSQTGTFSITATGLRAG